MSEDDKIRKEYFIQYRNGLWTQIRSKEDWVWKFISFYAGALILIGGLLKNDTSGNLSPILLLAIILIVIIVSFWGLLIVLDSNFWMQRNLIFIGNIEKELLLSKDYGVIIPKDYMHPSNFRYTTSFFIQIIFFSIILVFSLLGFLGIAIKNIDTTSNSILALSQVISITFCSLLFYSMNRNVKWIKEFGRVRDSAPGIEIEGIETFDKNKNEIKTYRNSGVATIFLLFTFFGTCSFIFSTIIMQPTYDFMSIVGYGILILFIVLFCVVILFAYLKKKIMKDKTILTFRNIFKIIQLIFLSACVLINLYMLVIISINELRTILI